MTIQNNNAENPLKSFFRKSKFKMTLPSAGKWYTSNSLTLNVDGTVDVFAMNASDDIRFRTGELALNGKSTVSLIQNCIPNITNPEMIPSIDIDPILLAIRAASYGDDFEITVDVPGTKLTRKLKLKISELLNMLPSESSNWDSELKIISDDGMVLQLILVPITLGQLFQTTKVISNQRRVLTSVLGNNENQLELSDDQIQKFDNSVTQVTQSAIDLICESISEVTLFDQNNNVVTKLNKSEPASFSQIKQLVNTLDIGYFTEIRNHLDAQRKKFSVKSGFVRSTPDEVIAGAEEGWQANIIFAGSDFFGK
jgi:hypothetical protein